MLCCLSSGSAVPELAEAAQRKITFYHTDHLGSTTLATDAQGYVVEQTEYLPYGAVSRHTGTVSTSHRFTGQRLDDTTGLYFYHARYYDPQLDRFISADSVIQAASDPQSLNRYSYVRNNPVRYTDPSGHGWFKKFFEKIWDWFKEKNTPQPSDPQWWFKQLRPATPIHPDTAQQFNQAINATATFMVNQWGFSPAAANATIGAVLAIPTGGNSLIAAGLAYGTTELLGTGEARQLIGNLAGFFEQFGVSPEASRTLATQVVSAGVAVAVAVSSASARALYNKLVHYDVTWAKGGAAVLKKPGDPPVPLANNIGVQGGPLNPNGLFNEGGIVSRLANQIPGTNATAGMHDVFQINLNRLGGPPLGWTLNVPGMLPAAALTYMSLLRPQEVSFSYGTGSYGAQDN